jgi:UDP:flavonoid glycosyltransferase YjiC (YdhE family)
MKVLLAATPLTGHVNPILSIGRILVSHGHEVVLNTATSIGRRAGDIGARFVPFPPEADLDLRDMDAAFPERKHLTGLDQLRFNFERLFFDPIPHQYAGFLDILEDFHADVLIADNFCFGTLPMLLGNRNKRPRIVHCGVSYLQCRRDDGAPFHAGYPPAHTEAQRQEYIEPRRKIEEDFLKPIHSYLDMRLAESGVKPLRMNVFDAAVSLPDVYMHSSVPGFEYPRRELPAPVHFVGSLASQTGTVTLPEWAHELDGAKRVVFATQGTLANENPGRLIESTLTAMADEPDVLVVVTMGGRPVNALRDPVPGNARIAAYLPFDWLLPKVDVVVTNGGYGTVNQALALGVPLVVAGLTEDKAEVSARVAWSGTGINLRTQSPSVDTLKQAIRNVLDVPDFREAAGRMAAEFATLDTEAEVLRLVLTPPPTIAQDGNPGEQVTTPGK